MVRAEGLEPSRLSTPDPKSGVSANSTTLAVNHKLAYCILLKKKIKSRK